MKFYYKSYTKNIFKLMDYEIYIVFASLKDLIALSRRIEYFFYQACWRTTQFVVDKLA